jgi:hypothetical protein
MDRIRYSIRPALIHLGISALIAAAFAGLVFFVWFPFPYREISGGRILFQILIAVDVIIGPLLTLIVFSPLKRKRALILDLGVVVLLQLSALGYGLWSVAQARPLFLAMEGDRYRVVHRADIDLADLKHAPPNYLELSWGPPRMLHVRLLTSKDPDFVNSIQQAMSGYHPAYRPERWEDYGKSTGAIGTHAPAIADIITLSKLAHADVTNWLAQHKQVATDFGYYEVLSEYSSDWIAIVNRQTGLPVYFTQLK